jgi:hypothetical protein
MALGAGVLLSGCEALWSAPQGPITAGGARLDESGRLDFWLGAECDSVGEIRVELAEGGDGRVLDTWIMRSTDPAGAPLEYLGVGVVPDGFHETNALAHDWTKAGVVRISLHAASDDAGAGDERRYYPDVPVRAYVSTETFLRDAENRRDEWYVQDHGWFTEAEYTELANDVDLIYPYCAVPR